MKPSEVKVEFNFTDQQYIGKPAYFDPDHYLDSVEQMVAADEVIFALEMLEKMPGYYRANPYPRAVKLKKEITKNLATLSKYASAKAETYEESLDHNSKLNPDFDWSIGLGRMIDIPFCYPRGPMVRDEVKELNKKGEIPFIWEFGAGNFWLPYGLLAADLKFNYYSEVIHAEALKDHKKRLEKVWTSLPKNHQKEIFVCFETIEHLWNLDEVLTQYNSYGANADIIYLSTPNCTLLGGQPLHDRLIEHIRTFTPKELHLLADKMFPGYEWSISHGPMLVIRGERK